MSLLAFFAAAIVLAVTPGPGIAYVVARTVAGGRAEGLASCLGTADRRDAARRRRGDGSLARRRAVGSGVRDRQGRRCRYLVYLGVRLLLQKDRDAPSVAVAAQGPRRALLEGIVVEVLNVKTALFFLAFLPQFVHATEAVVVQLVVLGTICVALNALVDVAAVLWSARLLASRAARAARERLLRRTSGATMVALGTLLALSEREA
jgi:threonine/homoserine/homoserine lactone efflux protein